MSDFDGFYIAVVLLPVLFAVLLIIAYRKGRKIPKLGLPHVLAWNLLIITFSLLFIFLLVESYYRFAVDTTDSFAISKITQRWGKEHYQYNNFNVRDNVDYPFKTQPELRRVTIIGDSFTVGYGIKDVDNRFVNIIRSALYDKEINMIAGNGYDTDRQFMYIQKFREQDGFEMDVLVLVYNLNDIAFLIPESAAIVDRIYAYEKDLNYLTSNSYFLNDLFFKWKGMTDPDMKNYFGYLKDSYKDGRDWQNMQAYLSQMVEYCKQNNLELLVVTFPFLHNFDKSYQFTAAHQQLGKFWTAQGIPNLDLLPVFLEYKGENLVVNSFDAHPNEKAHQIAAEAIGEFINQKVSD